MSAQILSITPHYTVEEGAIFNTNIFQADSGREKRAQKWTRKIRTFRFTMANQLESEADALWDFYVARRGMYDSFWMKAPTDKNKKSEDEAVGTGDNSQTVFNLDYFPIDTASLVLKHNGSVQGSGFTPSNDLNNEVSKITYSPAPGLGVVITATYEYYVRVRFMEDQLTRRMFSKFLFEVGINVIEDLWPQYTPPEDQ